MSVWLTVTNITDTNKPNKDTKKTMVNGQLITSFIINSSLDSSDI